MLTGSRCLNIIIMVTFLSNFKNTERHSFPTGSQRKPKNQIYSKGRFNKSVSTSEFVFCILHYFLQQGSVSPKDEKIQFPWSIWNLFLLFGQILGVKYLVSLDSSPLRKKQMLLNFASISEHPERSISYSPPVPNICASTEKTESFA